MGTFDELTEIYSMAQLGFIDKPFGLLNTAGYFDGFLAQLERAHRDRFIKDRDYGRLLAAEDIETLLARLDHWAEERKAAL